MACGDPEQVPGALALYPNGQGPQQVAVRFAPECVSQVNSEHEQGLALRDVLHDQDIRDTEGSRKAMARRHHRGVDITEGWPRKLLR